MAIFIVDLPIDSMVDLSIVFCKRLPERNHFDPFVVAIYGNIYHQYTQMLAYISYMDPSWVIHIGSIRTPQRLCTTIQDTRTSLGRMGGSVWGTQGTKGWRRCRQVLDTKITMLGWKDEGDTLRIESVEYVLILEI